MTKGLGILWARFWMLFAGRGRMGRIAFSLAGWPFPPYKGRQHLARMSPRGYVSPSADIYHDNLHLGQHVFIGDRVVIYQNQNGGAVSIGKGVNIHRDVIIEVGSGGSVTIESDTHIQPRCQFSAYKGSVRIGSCVQIAPSCSFYPYNHGFAHGELIMRQPLESKGGIVIEDDVWLGVGTVVLDNVRIGKGAVIGAGSVVAVSIPDGAIAVGVPARVVGARTSKNTEQRSFPSFEGQGGYRGT